LDSVQRLQFNDFRISMRGFKMRGNIQLFISFQITKVIHCRIALLLTLFPPTVPFLAFNYIASIPSEIGLMTNLQEINLSELFLRFIDYACILRWVITCSKRRSLDIEMKILIFVCHELIFSR
jgi:hypothetical protein